MVVVAATPTPQAENHVEDWSEKVRTFFSGPERVVVGTQSHCDYQHSQELSRRSGPQAPHSNVTCAQSLLWPVQQSVLF